ncbi:MULTISPECIES: DUF5363 family protein [unclassified Agarivorans]
MRKDILNQIVRFFRKCLVRYDRWLAETGLDKPCRSCIPREHLKSEDD